jgi:shikimate dehydrogenase
LGGEFHQAAVLGAGGAAAAAVLALALAGVDRIAVISRSASAAAALVARVAPALASSELVAARWGEPAGRELVRGAELVVNATPLGMGDEEGALQAFGRAGVATSNAHLLDLIYARRVTPFLSMATSPSLDGATMLVEQGAASWEIWTGRPAPRRVMYDALFGELGRSTPLWVGA